MAMAMELFLAGQEWEGPQLIFSLSPRSLRTLCRSVWMRILSKSGLPQSTVRESTCQYKRKRLKHPISGKAFCWIRAECSAWIFYDLHENQQAGGERNVGSGERDQVRALAAPQIKLCWWLVLKGSTSKRMLVLRRALAAHRRIRQGCICWGLQPGVAHPSWTTGANL